jgi:predicted nucleotidyltransferase
MKTKTLCKILGGSHLYHLNTPESDIDERGVFMHLDPKFIVGTKRFDEERRQPKDTDEDVVLKELSHYCSLLAKSNSEALELLFCNESEFTFLSNEFRLFRENARFFIDSEKLFRCLRGYMKGERRLMNGERKGQIGGKRYAKLQEVGYSPKNAVQLIRLANVGIHFFRMGEFIVDTRQFPDDLHESLFEVKTKPENFSKDEINRIVDVFEAELVTSFETRRVDFIFDEDKLNDLLLEIYLPILNKKG